MSTGYLLSKKEQRPGSPEKPLSGLGALGYKNYWTLALMRYLDLAPDKPSLEGDHTMLCSTLCPSLTSNTDISAATSMTTEDIHTTLTQQNMISSREDTPPPVRPSPGQSIKFPKGRKHGIARRHLQRTQTNDDIDTAAKAPFSPPTQYELRWDREKVAQYLATWEAKGYLKLKPEKLKWSPFLLARTKKTEGLQTLTTESLAHVDPITLDSTSITTNGPTTPQNGARHPSVCPDTNSQPQGHHPGNEINLPIFENQISQQDRNRSPSDEIHDTPRMKHPRSQPKIFTSSTNDLNGDSAVHGPSARGHHTRSASARASELEQSLADDEALAAKLALEERRSSRSLRSRPERTPDLRRTLSSTSATRSSSPRKRRRVESSPESEGGSLPNSGTPVNGIPSQQPNGLTSSRRHQRKTSQLLNGSTTALDTPHLPTLLPQHDIATVSPPSPTMKTSTTNNVADVDVKSEVATTPLTALTSRHSVPSDDTVIAINSERASNGELDSKAVERIEDKDPGGAMVLADEVADEDANADEDLDAEGDADADADEDLDAEGEIDAEGELDVEVTF
jgi:hypothetical protein